MFAKHKSESKAPKKQSSSEQSNAQSNDQPTSQSIEVSINPSANRDWVRQPCRHCTEESVAYTINAISDQSIDTIDHSSLCSITLLNQAHQTFLKLDFDGAIIIATQCIANVLSNLRTNSPSSDQIHEQFTDQQSIEGSINQSDSHLNNQIIIQNHAQSHNECHSIKVLLECEYMIGLIHINQTDYHASFKHIHSIYETLTFAYHTNQSIDQCKSLIQNDHDPSRLWTGRPQKLSHKHSNKQSKNQSIKQPMTQLHNRTTFCFHCRYDEHKQTINHPADQSANQSVISPLDLSLYRALVQAIKPTDLPYVELYLHGYVLLLLLVTYLIPPQPVNQSPDQSIGQSLSVADNPSFLYPLILSLVQGWRAANRPMDQSSDHPINQSSNQIRHPISESAVHLYQQSVDRQTHQSINQSINHLVLNLDSQISKELINQAVNPTINQSTRQSFFVLNSYSQMIIRLKAPLYTPNNQTIKQWKQTDLLLTQSINRAIKQMSHQSVDQSDQSNNQFASQDSAIHLSTKQSHFLSHFLSIRQSINHGNNEFNSFTPLIVVGESHSLSVLWHFLRIKQSNCQPSGKSNNPAIKQSIFQFHPGFVMGLKAYHFAPRCNSYVSKALDYSIQSINRPIKQINNQSAEQPKHSSIMLIQAGEIDCRLIGGITLAYEKSVYQSLNQSINQTAEKYIDGVIIRLIDRCMHGLVCPVRPPPLKNKKVKKSAQWESKQSLKQSNDQSNNQSISQTINQPQSVSHSDNESIKYDVSNLQSIQLVYKHALLIRDFNQAIERLVKSIEGRDLRIVAKERDLSFKESIDQSHDVVPTIHWLNFYETLCTGPIPAEHRSIIQLTEEPCTQTINQPLDASIYLLNGRYSLEGLHLNSLYIEVLQSAMNDLHDKQVSQFGVSIFDEARFLNTSDLVPCPSRIRSNNQSIDQAGRSKKHEIEIDASGLFEEDQ